jgi:hypothetical protein
MPLANAYLCQDCNSVGNCPAQCPACASRALMGLAIVLDRKADMSFASVLNRKGDERPQIAYSRVPALAA